MSKDVQPYNGVGSYIFVSYSHKDETVVLDEISHLMESGYRVWFDKGIEPGELWKSKIVTAINNCAFFLVFMSPSASESKYVNNEIDYANTRGKSMIVVMMEEFSLPDSLLFSIQHRQFLFKYKENAADYFKKLIKSIPGETKGAEIKRTTDEEFESPAITSKKQDEFLMDDMIRVVGIDICAILLRFVCVKIPIALLDTFDLYNHIQNIALFLREIASNELAIDISIITRDDLRAIKKNKRDPAIIVPLYKAIMRVPTRLSIDDLHLDHERGILSNVQKILDRENQIRFIKRHLTRSLDLANDLARFLSSRDIVKEDVLLTHFNLVLERTIGKAEFRASMEMAAYNMGKTMKEVFPRKR